MYVCMVSTFGGVWINRVWLQILLMVPRQPAHCTAFNQEKYVGSQQLSSGVRGVLRLLIIFFLHFLRGPKYFSKSLGKRAIFFHAGAVGPWFK